jgi:hypothetical protein
VRLDDSSIYSCCTAAHAAAIGGMALKLDAFLHIFLSSAIGKTLNHTWLSLRKYQSLTFVNVALKTYQGVG